MTAVAELERVQMESKNYCAYNRTQGCFLSLRISTADASHQSAHEQLQSLADNSQSGLWISPFVSLPEGHARLVFDLVYLDQDYRVLAIESFPNPSARQPDKPIASALALPPRTITATITQPGDELIIWSLSESNPQPQRGGLTSRVGRSRAASASRGQQTASSSVTPAARPQDQHAPADTTPDADADTSQQPSFFKRLFRGRLAAKDDAPVSLFASGSGHEVAPPQAASPIPLASKPPATPAPSPAQPPVEAAPPPSAAASIPAPAPEPVRTPAPQPVPAVEVAAAQAVAPELPAPAAASSIPPDAAAPPQPAPQTELSAPAAAIEPSAVQEPEPVVAASAPPTPVFDTVPAAPQSQAAAVIPESASAAEPPVAQQEPPTEPATLIAADTIAATPAPPELMEAAAPQQPAPQTEAPPPSPVPAAPIEPFIVPPAPAESAAAPAAARRLVAIPGPNGTAFVVQSSEESHEKPPAPPQAAPSADSVAAAPAQATQESIVAPPPPAPVLAPAAAPAQTAPVEAAQPEPAPSADHVAQKSQEWKKARKHAQRKEKDRRDAKRKKFKFQSSTENAPSGPSIGKRFVRWLTAPPTAAKRMRTPEIVAYFWTGGTPRPHTVANISVTGLYILTKDRWLPDTVLVMNLQWTDTDGNHPGDAISVLAKVVRSGDDGVGFQFVTSDAVDLGVGQYLPGKGADRVALDRFLWRRKRAADQASA